MSDFEKYELDIASSSLERATKECEDAIQKYEVAREHMETKKREYEDALNYLLSLKLKYSKNLDII